MKHYVKLMRPHHWIKNLLIFLPILFSGQLFNFSLLIQTIYALGSFCFVSSIIYIINDIRDRESDRQHSKKCNRPIASGKVSVKNAGFLAAFLFFVVAVLNVFAFRDNYLSWLVLAIYFVVNLAYSMGLKNLPIIDVTMLVSGFMLRLLYGSVVTHIEISDWLYFTVMSMSFYLVFGKRRNEMKKQTGETRKVLQYYSKDFLDKFMYLSLTLTIAFYSLWTVHSASIDGADRQMLIWTVPLVIIICMKYSMNIESDSEGDPIDVVLSDKILLALIGLYALFMLALLYV